MTLKMSFRSVKTNQFKINKPRPVFKISNDPRELCGRAAEQFFLKIGPIRSSFIYYDPFYRTYKYTMTQINFLPPPGFEPGSLAP